MSLDVLGDLNYLAVVAAALAYFVLGGLWYAPPVFGTRWAAAVPFDLPEKPNPLIYLGTLVAWFAVALSLAYLGALIGVDGAVEGLGLGLLAGLGIMLPVMVVSALYDQTKGMVLAIGAGYNLVGFALAGLIIGAWT